MGLFDDPGGFFTSDLPNFFQDRVNNAVGILGKLEGAAGNLLDGAGGLAKGLGDLFNSPIFLYIMIILGGFIAYKMIDSK